MSKSVRPSSQNQTACVFYLTNEHPNSYQNIILGCDESNGLIPVIIETIQFFIKAFSCYLLMSENISNKQ